MFTKLPPNAFRAFHDEFHGDTWDICERCGGQCEINKIGSLMPGEAEYLAATLNKDVAEFRRLYLDGIETPFGLVDVLKLKPGCPFLSADFKCTIADVKVILCDVYPVVFDVDIDKVQFTLDRWCPIVRHAPELAAYFADHGIPALKRLAAATPWYQAVALYDALCVDYQKLSAKRKDNPDYAILSVEDVQACQADDAPPPEIDMPSRIGLRQV